MIKALMHINTQTYIISPRKLFTTCFCFHVMVFTTREVHMFLFSGFVWRPAGIDHDIIGCQRQPLVVHTKKRLMFIIIIAAALLIWDGSE